MMSCLKNGAKPILIVGLTVAIGLSLVSASSFAVESSSVGSAATPSLKPSAAASISIPCLDAKDKVMNASENDVCKGILPRCADLKKEIETSVRGAMSLKIWGYYKGLDADLDRSSLAKLEGEPLANPVCSLVGHKMQNNGNTSDFEVTKQTIGDKKDCGKPPAMDNDGLTLKINYSGANGSLWIAYMQGAYPWLIRKHTYEVLNLLDANLSNLDKVLTISGMAKDVQGTVDKMKTFSKGLSTEAKASCEKSTKGSNLVKQCTSGAMSVNDPAQRICTLVKAQLVSNGGALPSMIIAEIMDGKGRVHEQYASIFGTLLDFSNGSSNAKNAKASNSSVQNLLSDCANSSGFLRTKKKKLAMTASCLLGEQYCVRHRCKDSSFPTRLSDEFLKGSSTRTNNKGIVGVIEKLIRHDICGQNKISDPSVCDLAGIPSKPVGVE
jgi:hypothetical protein